MWLGFLCFEYDWVEYKFHRSDLYIYNFFFIPAKVTRSQNTDLIDRRLNPYTGKLGEKYLYAQEREPKYGQID